MVAIRALFIDNKLFDIYWKSLWIFYRFFSFFRLFFLVFCFLFSDLSIAYHIYISTYSTKSIYDFPKHKFFFNSLLQLLCLFIRIKLSSRIMNRWFFSISHSSQKNRPYQTIHVQPIWIFYKIALVSWWVGMK